MTNTPRPAPPDSRPGPAPAAPKVDGLLLERLNDLFEQVMAQIFVAPHSNRMFNVMTGAQKRVLLLLALSGPLRMSEVAQRTGMAPSAASATLDGLEKLGLARRGPDPADRRVVLAALTEAGHETHRHFRQIHEQRLAQVLGQLHPDKGAELVAAFARIHDLLSELGPPAPGCFTHPPRAARNAPPAGA